MTRPLARDGAGARGAIFLVPLLGVFWGFNWPAVRLCLNEIPPWTLRVVGFSLGAMLLAAFVRLSGTSLAVPRRHWWRVAVVGILSVAAYNIFSAFAQLSATTSRTAVLSYTMPIWTVLLAWLFLREPIDRRRQMGLALGAAGLVCLGWPIVAAGDITPGLFYALASGIVWAAGSTVLKRFPIDASPLTVSVWQLAIGAATTLVGMLAFEGLPAWRPLSPIALAALAYNIVLGQAAAAAIWFTMLSRLPAGIAAIGSLLVPGIGVLGAMLILGERPTAADWIGLVLIVAASASVLVRGGPTSAEPA